MKLMFTNAVLSAVTSSKVVVSPAAASKLTILTQPSSTATAGVPFAQQPQVRIEDQFGNLRSGDNTTVVSASRNAGSGVLQGTTNVTASGGIVSFANLAHNVATNITLQFTSGAPPPPPPTRAPPAPPPASGLTIVPQPPPTATAGSAFAQQPVVRIEDAFGNLIGSDNSTLITAARSAGSGTLQGALNATALNGVAAFTNLSHNVATNITLAFSGPTLTRAPSPTIPIRPPPLDHFP